MKVIDKKKNKYLLQINEGEFQTIIQGLFLLNDEIVNQLVCDVKDENELEEVAQTSLCHHLLGEFLNVNDKETTKKMLVDLGYELKGDDNYEKNRSN